MIIKMPTASCPDIYQIIDMIPASIYWKDIDGRYLACNKFVMDMAGVTDREQIIGKIDAELPWKATAARLKEIDNYVIKNGEYQVEETPIINNEKRIFLTTKNVFHDENQKVQGIIGVSLDITDQRKREKLEKAQAAHDEEVKMLQLLSGAIAHELRTPLATVNNISYYLKKFLSPLMETYSVALKNNLSKKIFRNHLESESLLEAPQDIHNEVLKCNQFIDTILLLSKQQQIQPEEMKVLSVKFCVEEALRRFALRSKENDLIHVDIQYDFEFKGVSLLFEHILFNLIKNALFYIKQQQKGEIFISTESNVQINNRKWNVLNIKDTAKGMSKEHLEFLFTRFFSNREGGTGIGLAFSQQIMTMFGGEISCDAVENEYTHFSLKFPLLSKDLEDVNK